MNKNGITLIALVVTIIVLLILAAVSITLILGPDGVVEKAREAKVTGRYNTIMDMLTTREAELAVVLKTGLTTGGAKSAKSFVEDLMSEGLITADEYYEEEDDYITVYLGKQSDGTYKYEIEVREGLALEYSPNMILSIKTTTVNEEVELPINDTAGLTINWNAKDDPNNFVAPNDDRDPTHVYSQPDTYEVQIKGQVLENTYFGHDCYEYTNENIVELKNWGENGFYYFWSFGKNLTGNIPTPNNNSFINTKSFNFTFVECTELTTIPANLFVNCPNVTSFEWVFAYCANLTNLPEGLFANCPNVTSFKWTFAHCTSLTNLPESIFDNSPNAKNFEGAFFDCSNLIGTAPELWERLILGLHGLGCFYNCTQLSNYNDIPGSWKAGSWDS